RDDPGEGGHDEGESGLVRHGAHTNAAPIRLKRQMVTTSSAQQAANLVWDRDLPLACYLCLPLHGTSVPYLIMELLTLGLGPGRASGIRSAAGARRAAGGPPHEKKDCLLILLRVYWLQQG